MVLLNDDWDFFLLKLRYRFWPDDWLERGECISHLSPPIGEGPNLFHTCTLNAKEPLAEPISRTKVKCISLTLFRGLFGFHNLHETLKQIPGNLVIAQNQANLVEIDWNYIFRFPRSCFVLETLRNSKGFFPGASHPPTYWKLLGQCWSRNEMT
ncbi:hypothetical protein JTB14_038132 [Gonioctena quinquepunctata]|nr:hypothetical protein JTB14_038132 [Gonioctena quinquepunctata]